MIPLEAARNGSTLDREGFGVATAARRQQLPEGRDCKERRVAGVDAHRRVLGILSSFRPNITPSQEQRALQLQEYLESAETT